MSEPATLNQIRRASQRAAILTAIGAAVVLLSLIYSAVSIHELDQRRVGLSVEISTLNSQVMETRASLGAKSAALTQTTDEIHQTKAELTKAEEQLSQARCALAESRSAIEAFHQRAYDVAIKLYTSALTCDPDNAYLLNLKAYSIFKAGRVDDAIDVERHAVDADPSYAWGYFDLARFLCASGPAKFPEAKNVVGKAFKLRPGLEQVMRGDGEFMRLCRGLLP